MLKKIIKYVDFNGTEREEEFYFHLSLPEVTRINASFRTKDIQAYAQELIKNQQLDKMLALIEDIILSSYGEKTEDGRSFRKTLEIRAYFENSQAYAELFEELFNDVDKFQNFITNILPKAKASDKPVLNKFTPNN